MKKTITRHLLIGLVLWLASWLTPIAFAGEVCPDGPYGVPGVSGPASSIGQWGPVVSWPEQATHVTVLHTGKVLWWRGNPPNGDAATTYVWDPVTETQTIHLTQDNNVFCAGHTTLEDGRVLTLGGNVNPQNAAGLPDTNLFDPITETWSTSAQSTYARWYPTLTLLRDGRVLAIAGRIQKDPPLQARIPEIWDPNTGVWSELPGLEYGIELYTQMFQVPDGRVVNTSTNGTTRALTIASEQIEFLPSSNFTLPQGSAAMYRPGKIVRIGGGGISTSDVETLDTTVASPSWTIGASMAYARRRPDLTLLPDGRALAVGGSVQGQNDPDCAVHAAEIYDPIADTWTEWASMSQPRIYHSTAVLLPDARVLVAGGEAVRQSGSGEKNYEIFSPPYLFQGPRPTITSAPASVGYGESFNVPTPDAGSISSVVFMRPSSVTHNFDQNQRYVPLTFVANGASLDVTSPANGNWAPPGYYMLFILDGSGVPSEAKFVQLTAGGGSAVPAMAGPKRSLLFAAVVFFAAVVLGRTQPRRRLAARS